MWNEDESEVKIGLKEYNKYIHYISNDYLGLHERNTEDGPDNGGYLGVNPDALPKGCTKRKPGRQDRATDSSETYVRLRKSDNYYCFHSYQPGDSVSHTILPSVFIPSKPKRDLSLPEKRISLPVMTSFQGILQKKTPLLRVPSSNIKLPHINRYENRKRPSHVNADVENSSRHAAQEQSLPAMEDESKTSRSTRDQKKSKKPISAADGDKWRPQTPKIIPSATLDGGDRDHYSVQNLDESHPAGRSVYVAVCKSGRCNLSNLQTAKERARKLVQFSGDTTAVINSTVKLSVFYHEPIRRPHAVIADIVDKDAGKATAPNIKGFTFDKTSLSYIPLDTGPAKPVRPVVRSMASIADVVLFKVHMNRILRENQVNSVKLTAKQQILNRARRKLNKLKNRQLII